MSFKEILRSQRAGYCILVAVLLVLIIGLYIVAFKDASFEAGMETPENNDAHLPEETIGTIKEPEFSYNVTTINVVGLCTPASMLGSSSYGTFNSFVKDNGTTYFLRNLTDIFRNDTFTLAGCNAVFSDDSQLTPAEKNDLEWYLASASNANVFVDGCIDGVSLECKRTGDYGTAGYKDTKEALESSNLLWTDSGKAIYLVENGIKIAIYSGKLTESNALGIISWTEGAKQKNDFVILYITDLEDGYMPSSFKKSTFRSFIDAGADVVVGTNGTKLQSVEMYKDGLIAYSLGALIDGSTKYPDKYSAVLQISIKSDNGIMAGTSYEVLPCLTYGENKPWQPSILTSHDELTLVNAFLRGERDTPYGK